MWPMMAAMKMEAILVAILHRILTKIRNYQKTKEIENV